MGCFDSVAGIKKVLIAKYDDTATFTETAGVITAITYGSPAETYYEFKFANGTSTFGDEGTHSIQNGTNFYTQTVTMTFHKLETAKRNAIKLLAQTSLHVIVETMNGDYWLVGRVAGANVSASTGAAGTALGDLNGYTLTLTAMEPELAIEVDSATIASLTTSA